MSKFLAPIHTWLFNKILIVEQIEKEMLTTLATPTILEQRKEDVRTLGDFIPPAPLEDLIDQSNIHGWLQDRITRAERRQAKLVHQIYQHVEGAKEKLSDIYSRTGSHLAHQYLSEGGLKSEEITLKDIYDLLGNVLLEGMPCDRVNRVIDATPDLFVWATDSCVHQQNWAYADVPVQIYYDFRADFTRAFASVLRPDATYTYTNNEGQLHTLQVKKGN